MKIKIIALALLLSAAVQAQKKVWFDTDIMIGMPDKTAREVDDGFTLIMALKQPQIEIVGISSITYVDYSFPIINKILGWHNKGAAIPVYKGSPNADDLGVVAGVEANKIFYLSMSQGMPINQVIEKIKKDTGDDKFHCITAQGYSEIKNKIEKQK